MVSKLSIWTCAAMLVMAFPSTGSARPKEAPPQPGYECTVGESFDVAAWGSATLDAAGKIVRSNWTWRTPLAQERFTLRISQFGDSVGLAQVSRVAISSIIWNNPLDAAKRPERRMVQATTSPEKRYIWGALGTGKVERSYNPRVDIHWSDLLAFAKGAAVINLNLLDEKWGFLDSVSIEPSLFLKADSEIQAMLQTLNARIANFESECINVDDIVERDILV